MVKESTEIKEVVTYSEDDRPQKMGPTDRYTSE